MNFNFDSYSADCRIFVEQYKEKDSRLYSTGVLVELPSWTNVKVNVSNDLGKSISISMENSNAIFTRTKSFDTLQLQTPNKEDRSDASVYISETLLKYREQIYFSNKEMDDSLPSKIIKNFTEGFCFYISDKKDLTQLNSDVKEPSFLTLMQRIWVVFKTKGLGVVDKDKDKYSIVAGIITSFDYEESGISNSFSIQAHGLSRFLELAQIPTGKMIARQEQDLYTIVNQYIAESMFGDKVGFDNFLSTLPPEGILLYVILLTNALFTKQGFFFQYDSKFYQNYFDEDNQNTDRHSQFFI